MVVLVLGAVAAVVFATAAAATTWCEKYLAVKAQHQGKKATKIKKKSNWNEEEAACSFLPWVHVILYLSPSMIQKSSMTQSTCATWCKWEPNRRCYDGARGS